MNTIALIVILLYLVGMIIVGVYGQRKGASDSSKEFWIAGGRVKLLPNMIAFFSAFASGGAFLGVVGAIYALGAPYMWVASTIGAGFGCVIAAIFVAPQLRRSEGHTVVDFFKKRFPSKSFIVVASLIVFIYYSIYLIAQFKAGAITIQFFVPQLPYTVALILITVVFVLYVALGGMWAITLTDVIQGVLMFVTMWALAISVIMYFGGPGNVISEALSINPTWGIPNPALGPAQYIGFACISVFAAAVLPHLIMRLLSSNNPKGAAWTINSFIFLYGVYGIAWLFVAAAGVIWFPAGSIADLDTVFLLVMNELWHPIIQGIAGAAVLAAIMSTTDGVLLACSAAVSNDLLPSLKPGIEERKLLRIGKIMLWVVAFIGVLLALNPPQLIVILYTQAMGWLASAFFWPLVLGIWWKRTNTPGAFAGMLTGMIVYPILIFVVKMPTMTPILLSIPIAGIVTVIVSKLTAAPSPSIIQWTDGLHKKGSEYSAGNSGLGVDA